MIQLGERTTIVASFQKMTCEKNDWRICYFYAEPNQELPATLENLRLFVAKGIITPKYEGEIFELTGEWSRYKKSGEIQFEIQYAIPCVPTTKETAAEFIKASIKGVGKKTAEVIVNWCDGDLQKIADEPLVLAASVKGLSERRAKAIAKKIDEASATAALSRLLKKVADPQLIRRLVNAYGSDAYEIVKNNPYSCIKVIGFDAADKIALAQDFKPQKPERIEAAIMSAMYELRAKNCSIVVPKRAHYSVAAEKLESNVPHATLGSQVVSNELIDQSIQNLKMEKVLAATKGDNGFLYLREDFDMEKELAKNIFEIGTHPISDEESAKFCAAFDSWSDEHPDIHLHPNQAAAVCAASNLFSVVTGGPGTGKTTVLKAIMETYKKVYPDNPIVLMAPTGLAAKRMTESCERPALTIHKALGLIPADTPSGFSVSGDVTLAGGLIIVDEFSMVGIHLANFLINAIEKLPGTHIVFVGDVDQLPSVTPGSVLQDLINCGKVPVTRLTKNYRQASGSMIADCAVKVNTGDSRNLKFEKDCLFLECPESDIVKNIMKAYQDSIDEFGLAQTYVITPTHKNEKDPLSSNSLNKVLQEMVNPQGNRPQVEVGSRIFRVGDRVINKKNSAEVINGDIGVITDLIPEDMGVTLKIDFSGEIIEFPPERLKDLELAYAITVHSSQGCEFQSVIMPVSTSHRFMLSRNLTYTAITRAKKRMLMIGSMSAMVASAANVKTGELSDLLCARLANMS